MPYSSDIAGHFPLKNPTQNFQPDPQPLATQPAPTQNKTDILTTKIQKFQNDLLAFQANHPNLYTPDLYQQFFDYWTQHNPNGTTLLYEATKRKNHGIFDLARRLATWNKNNQRFNNTTTTTIQNRNLQTNLNAIDQIFQNTQNKDF